MTVSASVGFVSSRKRRDAISGRSGFSDCGGRAKSSLFQGEGDVTVYDGGHCRSVHHLLDALPTRLHRTHVRRPQRRRPALRPLDLLLRHGQLYGQSSYLWRVSQLSLFSLDDVEWSWCRCRQASSTVRSHQHFISYAPTLCRPNNNNNNNNNNNKLWWFSWVRIPFPETVNDDTTL